MSNTRKQNPSPTLATAAASRRPSSLEETNRKALPLSALDLVPLVEGSTSVAALQAAAELAQAVDRFGYTRLWYAEHHNMPGIATTIPEILIAHVGSMTSRIRLGAGGVMLPNHSPLQVAESYKLLEAIYPGRIDLGIGRAPGTDALTALALRRSRKALTADDFLEQLGELIAWGSGTFPPDNPFRAVRAMPDDRPLPPLYLLGSSNDGANLAAEMGVAFAFAGHFSPDPPEVAMRAYRTGFFSNGVLDKPYAILALSVFCADTEEAARRMASSMLLSFALLRTGHPGRLPSPEEAISHAYTPEEEKIVTFFKKLRIVGTPEQVRARIQDIATRSEADEVMIATHAYDPAARIRSYQLVAQAFDLPQFTPHPSESNRLEPAKRASHSGAA
ncbi:MAG: LLM class flavin-dependent oxidoreductase [Candidatus Acidiferrales bacterium]|jgi:luciferase family oxidoreductase group 1